jgi:hypothetical protein
MTINKTEIVILSCAIEALMNKDQECSLNENGVKKLAEIFCKFSEKMIPINAKDVIDATTQRMLETINYQKD